MKLEDLQVYQISMKLADEVHDLVIEWDNFHKFSTGTQLVDAADSVSANISEGYGRFHFKDHKNFLYFSRALAMIDFVTGFKIYSIPLLSKAFNAYLS